MVAALFAAVPLRNVSGNSSNYWHANPLDDPPDPLSTYSKAAFVYQLNSIFQVYAASKVVEVTLKQIDDMPAPAGGECFTLMFRGGTKQLKQNTYKLAHPSLGTFSLLLVPTGPDRNGAQGYVATINRLTYVQNLNNPPPKKKK
jgi:hypothetical protein